MTTLNLHQGILIFVSGAVLLALLKLWKNVSTQYLSSIRHLQGPLTKSWLFGNLNDMSAEHIPITQRWMEQYGPNLCIRGLFMKPILYTIDTRLINHIITHSMDYYKPPEGRRDLENILGRGVLVMEGETHRQQRHVMNPAFGPSQIRELTEVFLDKAGNLCDYWMAEIDAQKGVGRINVIEGLSKMTLDVIGLAGFNYNFDALNTEKPPNELNQAFAQIFKTPPKSTIASVIKKTIPILGYFRDAHEQKIKEAYGVMQRIAREIFQERKAELLRGSNEKSGGVAKKDLQGRDLLTLLIKANMATDIPDNQRMTDEEVLAQVPTFLVAGHETTSTATTWCLYALSRTPHIQNKLREELLSIPTDTPSIDDLMALPYLDQVVRESLRLYGPVTATSRVAQRDDVLPISQPFLDKHGNMVHEIKVKEGNRIIMSIVALNTSKALWGEDANEFRPERWDSPPEATSNIPGVWSNLLTFLGGPHACIGYRFSIAEMKALVFTLIRTFEFELSFTPDDMKTLGTFVQRPSLHSQKAKGSQLPLLLSPYKRV